jgi:hypothetical protein
MKVFGRKLLLGDLQVTTDSYLETGGGGNRNVSC